MQPTHDLVLRGGTVVDGTGAERRVADVAVDAGRITAVGSMSGTGREEIDARDLLVTPGWVDAHTHYDGQVSWDDEMSPSSWHGVTTAVMGNCGVGFAPVRPDRHDWLIALMEGVEDIPGTALHEGITWGWESFPEYLHVIARRPRTIDIGTQIPHSALRGYVMGDRGGDHREIPSDDEIAEMGRLVAESLRAGALGFSTSRTVAHRSSDGTEVPTLTASEAELLGIARAMRSAGVGVIEAVADLVDLEAEMALFRNVSSTAGRPLTLTVLQRPGFPTDEYTRILDHIDRAAADGIDLYGQVPARPIGLVMSLDGRLNPLMGSPAYQAIAALPTRERAIELSRPDVREQVLRDVEAGWASNVLNVFGGAYPMGADPEYFPGPDAEVRAVAASTGRTVAETILDVLVADDGRGMLYVPFANFVERDARATHALLTHARTVPGLSDAGAHCTMVCDASAPTFMLTHWARDAAPEFRQSVEWAVARQCRDTARSVGLFDRGVIAPGYRADLNVIDFDALHVGRPEILRDLPAGGKRLVQRPSGYRQTIVAGETIMRDSVPTGARPGALVRGAQPAPTC